MQTLKEKLLDKIKPTLNENAMKVLLKRYLKPHLEFKRQKEKVLKILMKWY